MKLLRSLMIVGGVACALALTAETASANPIPGAGCTGPGCAGGGGQQNTLAGSLMGGRQWHPGQNLRLPVKQKLPVFQAAPWYTYWPYDGYFLTPAPVQGAFYAPPVQGNFPVNPYFPPPGAAGGHPMPVPPGYPLPPPMPIPPR
jgi:hypothetical protein